jgi:hypothetical protein
MALLRSEVAQPAPLCRDRCGSRAPTRLQCWVSLALALTRVRFLPPCGIDTTSARTLAARDLALGRSPAVSERASHEVPGCGHASRAVSLAALSDLGPPCRLEGGACASDRARLRCLVGRPLAARLPSLPTARPRRATFNPYKDTGEPGPCRPRGGTKWGFGGDSDSWRTIRGAG